MLHARFVLALSLAIAAMPMLAHGHDVDDKHSIDKVNGSITAEAGHSYGSLETVNGSIRIEANARTDDAETVNGSISVATSAVTADLSTVNGSIRLADNVRVNGGVETVNGSVFVDRQGRIAEGVETVNGGIGLVATELGGGIATVNGDITVGIGSHVRGGIKIEKPTSNWMPIQINKRKPPRVVIGPNARVDGALVFEREVKLYVHRSASIGPVTGATAVRYDGERAPQD